MLLACQNALVDPGRRHSLRAALATLLAGSLGPLAACGGGGDEPEADPAAASTAQWAVDQGLMGVSFGWIDARSAQVGTDLAAAGLRRSAGVALRTSDDWYVGSNGKAMTAMVIARLVAQGTLAWTDTVATRLPALASDMRSDYAAVTLANWLDHRGGVLALNGSGDDEARFMADLAADTAPLPDTLAGRRTYAVRWVLRQAPAAGVRPGVDYFYSNAGYMIAAAMAEAASGQPFEQLLQSQLAVPLGLSLNALMPSERAADAVIGHTGLRAQLAPVPPLATDEEAWMQALAPAGFWATTPASYADWLKALLAALQGQASPLPADAVARLRTLSADSYALGWACLSAGGQALLYHLGAYQGCMTEVIVERSGRWAAFGMTNTLWMDADGSSWVASVLDDGIARMLGGRKVLQAAGARVTGRRMRQR